MYNIKKEGTSPEVASVNIVCNTGSSYSPKTDFCITYNDTGFHVHFEVYESNPLTKCTNNFDLVCMDSCVEWFVCFAPDISDRYFNFEINSNCCLDGAFCKDRHDFVKLTESDAKSLNIVSDVSDNKWTIDYTVPFELIAKYIDGYKFRQGTKILANVYKCCGSTQARHSICWVPVNTEKPDFHKPEYFQTMNII